MIFWNNITFQTLIWLDTFAKKFHKCCWVMLVKDCLSEKMDVGSSLVLKYFLILEKLLPEYGIFESKYEFNSFNKPMYTWK